MKTKLINLTLFLCSFLAACGGADAPDEEGRQLTSIVTEEYEFLPVADPDAVLILFPGGGTTSKETKADFDIVEQARNNNISLLLMNFNRRLWVTQEQKAELAKQIEQVLEQAQATDTDVFIGGMSIGGNVALSVGAYLYEINSPSAPQGVFIVDSPIDLYALYQSSLKDIANPDFSDERKAEPQWIVNFFEEEFSKDSILQNIAEVSPFTFKSRKTSVADLKESKIRFYTEPDAEWWMENRKTEFENTNAYVIQEVSKQQNAEGPLQIELIETQGKGYRSNGERHPHSWSIVDVDDLIKWIKE